MIAQPDPPGLFRPACSAQPGRWAADSEDALAIGDGGYLFDPRGDLRAWMLYPCVVACTITG